MPLPLLSPRQIEPFPWKVPASMLAQQVSFISAQEQQAKPKQHAPKLGLHVEPGPWKLPPTLAQHSGVA
jgi:hypothetical protein